MSLAFVAPAPERAAATGRIPDGSYRELLGAEAWARLQPEIRQRFSVRPADRTGIVFQGTGEVRRSRLGWLIAQACRLLGTPVVPQAGRAVAVAVELTADRRGGVCWRRRYRFGPGREAVARSTKRISRDGAMEEHLGLGLAMRLEVFERAGNLHFLSTEYRWYLGAWSLKLPGWLSPGTTEVVHAQLRGAQFRFTLRVVHPRFGELFYQDGVFREAGEL